MTPTEPDRRAAEGVPLRVVEAHQTCGMCPSQWEGTTDDGRVVYARYRHGELTVGVGADLDAAVLGAMQWGEPRGDLLVSVEPDLPDDGYMTPDELADLTRHAIAWPWDVHAPRGAAHAERAGEGR